MQLIPYNVRMALKQKTVYFREEDLPKWEAISNKAEWLHEHLNQGSLTYANMDEIFSKVQGDESPRVILRTIPISVNDEQVITYRPTEHGVETLVDGEVKMFEGQLPDDTFGRVRAVGPRSLCEHYQPKGECNVKDCKYGRGKIK